MFDVYEVQAWWLFTPWVLFGVAVIALAVFWRIAVVLNRSNGRAQEELTRRNLSHEKSMEGWKRAEAEARESSAAHQACARKLEAEKAEVAKWKGLAEIWQGKAAKLHQKRGKDGKFQPKKKSEKSRARKGRFN